MAALVTARTQAFIPGASPPEVRTPIELIFFIFALNFTDANIHKNEFICGEMTIFGNMKRIIVYLLAAALCSPLFVACSGRGSSSGENSASTLSESENPVIEAIMARRSIRKYQDRPVARETLQLIAECGVNAPNGGNSQRWEVRILDNADKIASISESFKQANPRMAADPDFKNMFRNAPAVFFIAVPEGDDGVNAGLMGENMMLAAYSLGLGSVCLGGPVNYLRNSEEGRQFVSELGFSEGYKVLFLIGVGYPDETPDAKPRDLSKIRFAD